MPDPLLNEDLGRAEEQNAGTGAYQAPLEDPIRKGEMNLDRRLPEAGSPQLNRTARQVGGAIGGMVSQARRLPNTARRGLHLVRDRAQDVGAQTGEQISGAAQQRIRDLTEAARGAGERVQQRAGELMDAAEDRGRALLGKADELSAYVADRTAELKEKLDIRTRELRDGARIRVEEFRADTQTMIRRYPLQALGCVAGAAFLLGVSLRIVRSHNARY